MTLKKYARVALAATAASLALVACEPSSARLDQAATCPGCVIEWSREASLRDVAEAPLEIPAAIAFDGERYYVVGADTGHALNVYRADGAFLRRLDRRGEGPGEFMFITSLHPTASGVILLDRANGRRIEIASSLEVIEERRIAFLPEDQGHLMLSGGMEVVRARGPRVAGGYPGIYELLPNGDLGRAFASAESMVYLGPSTDSTFWVYDRDAHELEEFVTDGRSLRQLGRPSWFPEPVSSQAPRGERAAPDGMPAMVKSVITEAGLIWVLSTLPDPDWHGALPARPRDLLPVMDDLTDTVIEVLDYQTGRTVAVQRFERFVQRMLPGPRLVTVGSTGNGAPVVEIHRLTLLR